MREIDPGAQHADLYSTTFTAEESRQFTEQFANITQQIAAKMTAGVAVTDDSVQEIIGQHYDFCLKFWTPTRESYISLALGYVLPSPYHDAYESVATGLSQYHYDAIVVWANANLD